MSAVEDARLIVAHHMHGEPVPPRLRSRDGYLVLDPQTANAIVTVHDALNEANRAKFDTYDLTKAGLVAWKLIGGQSK